MRRSFLGQQNTENNNNPLNTNPERAVPLVDWNAFLHSNDLSEETHNILDLQTINSSDNDSFSNTGTEQVSSLVDWDEFTHANDLPEATRNLIDFQSENISNNHNVVSVTTEYSPSPFNWNAFVHANDLSPSTEALIDYLNINDVPADSIDNNAELHARVISNTQAPVELQPSFTMPATDDELNTNNVNNNNNNRTIIDLTENDRATQQSASYLIAELAKTSKYIRLEDYDFFNPLTLAPIFENVEVLQCQKDAKSARCYFVLDATKKEYVSVIIAPTMRTKKFEFLDKNQTEKISISNIYWDTKFDTLVYGEQKIRLTHNAVPHRLPIPMAELKNKYAIIKAAKRRIRSREVSESPVGSHESNAFQRLYDYQYFKATTCEPVEDLSKAFCFWASRLVNTTFEKDYFYPSTSQYLTYEKIVKFDELKQADFYWTNGEKVSEDCKASLYYSRGECYVNISYAGVTNHKEKVFLDRSTLHAYFTEEELDKQYAAYYSPSAELKKGIDVYSLQPNTDHTIWSQGACRLAKDKLTIEKLSQLKLPRNVYTNATLNSLFFKAPPSKNKRPAEENSNSRKQRRNA